jgi:signal transduction histidine kinase
VSIDVTVDLADHGLFVTVIYDGIGIPDEPTTRGGLANLRERAAAAVARSPRGATS